MNDSHSLAGWLIDTSGDYIQCHVMAAVAMGTSGVILTPILVANY